MTHWQNTLVLGLLMGGSFLVGQLLRPTTLSAQGRGPTNPPPVEPVTPPPSATAPIVYPDDSGQASSNNGFLAVTGSYGVGTSVLYLIDTVNRQMAVYEGRGGSAEQRRLVLVGARKLDLDLMLEGYNDRSEYDYRKLRAVFDNRGARDPDVTTGLETGTGPKK